MSFDAACRPALSLAMMITVPCLPVTIINNVLHGDRYVVILSGRIMVIDVALSASGARSLPEDSG